MVFKETRVYEKLVPFLAFKKMWIKPVDTKALQK